MFLEQLFYAVCSFTIIHSHKYKKSKEILLLYDTVYYLATLRIPQRIGFQSSGALSGCSVSWGKEVEKVM